MDQDDIVFDNVVNKIELNDYPTFMEFGVASGNTMVALLNNLARRGIKPKQLLGFDWFRGLPKEEDGVEKHNEWHETAFNLVDEINSNNKIHNKTNDFNQALQIVIDRFKPYEQHGIYVQIVNGEYSKTLNKETVEKYNIQPASFVNIDCDLYISAKLVLEFLVENNLMKPGCLVRYDDWIELDLGEKKAHEEACEKYGLHFDKIDNKLFVYRGKNAN